MEQKYYEIFKLRYEKIINSSLVIYKTLASHNNMAFSLKCLCKETDQFIQAVVLNKILKTQELTIELLEQISSCAKYDDLLKPLKIKKLKDVNQDVINKINKLIDNIINCEPKLTKLAVYFDKIVAKMSIESSDTKASEIIINSFNCMFALVEDKDDLTSDLSLYKNFIKVVTRYMNGE